MSIPTAGELRKMNGRKCEAVTNTGYDIVGEITVQDNEVFILHNNESANGSKAREMKGYDYSWSIALDYRDDNYLIIAIKSIKFLDETVKKPKRKDHTYKTQYVRSDGIIFTEDTIDGVRIEDLQEKEKEHIKEARRIRGLLNSHKAKF